MASNIKISHENIYGWICSTGHLLPSNDLELQRFEKLYPNGSVAVNEEAIDPFAIINKTRVRNPLSISIHTIAIDRQDELRLAARKHANLPEDILDQIRKNQQKNQNGSGDLGDH